MYRTFIRNLHRNLSISNISQYYLRSLSDHPWNDRDPFHKKTHHQHHPTAMQISTSTHQQLKTTETFHWKMFDHTLTQSHPMRQSPCVFFCETSNVFSLSRSHPSGFPTKNTNGTQVADSVAPSAKPRWREVPLSPTAGTSGVSQPVTETG